MKALSLTRRDAITGAMSAHLVAVAPVVQVAAAEPDATLRDLVRRWWRLEDEISTPPPGLTDDQREARTDRLADEHNALAEEIADTSATTIAGVLLKLGVSLTIMPQSEDYAHGRMIVTAAEDLKRLTGKAA